MDEHINVLTGDLGCLKEFRNIVASYEEAQDQCDEAKIEERRLEKELNLNKKNLREEIDTTVKKRRGEVADKYNVEIDKAQDKLRKVKGQRGRAKEKGIKERIEDETADLNEQNAELKNSIRSALKEAHLPKFCGTSYYFTLFFTKGPLEVLMCAITIIVVFLLLPAAVYVVLPFEKLDEKYTIPAFALTYFVVVVIFFFIYKIISDLTKQKHKEDLKNIRDLKDQVNGNKKQIKKIAKSIRRDKNEDMYGLGDYDAKIGELEAEIGNVTQSREDALKKFDENVGPGIVSEIENREMPRINEMENSYKDVVKKREDLETSIKETGLKISSEYESYIGKDYTRVEKIDKLIEIMETGRALTISDAINIYKTEA